MTYALIVAAFNLATIFVGLLFGRRANFVLIILWAILTLTAQIGGYL